MTVPALRRPRHPRGEHRLFKAQVHLTNSEYCALENAAREQGLAMGSFIREAAMAFVVGERLRGDGEDALDRRLARVSPTT